MGADHIHEAANNGRPGVLEYFQRACDRAHEYVTLGEHDLALHAFMADVRGHPDAETFMVAGGGAEAKRLLDEYDFVGLRHLLGRRVAASATAVADALAELPAVQP